MIMNMNIRYGSLYLSFVFFVLFCFFVFCFFVFLFFCLPVGTIHSVHSIFASVCIYDKRLYGDWPATL